MWPLVPVRRGWVDRFLAVDTIEDMMWFRHCHPLHHLHDRRVTTRSIMCNEVWLGETPRLDRPFAFARVTLVMVHAWWVLPELSSPAFSERLALRQ